MTENRLWWMKQPQPYIDIQYPKPWLHPDVIRFIDSLLTPDMRVLEHGGGGSTLWLAARVAQVVTVESDPGWYEQLCAAAPANVRLILHSRPGIPSVRQLELSKAGRFDFLLIDGDPVESRSAWIDAAGLLLKPGGILCLDNANRPEYSANYSRLFERAKFRKIFDCNRGDTRYLVSAFFQIEAPKGALKRGAE